MLLPGYLRQRLTPAYVNCLPAETRREVLKLLGQRRSLEVRRGLNLNGAVSVAMSRRLTIASWFPSWKWSLAARRRDWRSSCRQASAKSTYASVLFPPWLLASSNWNILAASHTTELAEKWGRRIRNLISEHSSTLGISLAGRQSGSWAVVAQERRRVLRRGRRDRHCGISRAARKSAIHERDDHGRGMGSGATGERPRLGCAHLTAEAPTKRSL